jgi:hypothetical protein
MIKKSYNGNELSVVFGVLPVAGFVKGTSLIIEKRDDYRYSRDLHGNVTRSRINDNSAKVTLNLTKASSSNALLSNYVELDNQSDSGVFPIFIKDLYGNNIFTSKSASILSNNEHWQDEDNEWVIMATDNIFN